MWVHIGMEPSPKVLFLFLDGDDPAPLGHAQEIQRLLGERCALRVVDINEDPDLAEVTGISETPTLVRLAPDPRRKISGDLSNHEEAAAYLGSAWAPRVDQVATES